jgi:hypothetical protein
MGYPSTYAACMANNQYLTDTSNMASVKAAGACAAAVEKLHDEELKREEANLQRGYPELGIPPTAGTQPSSQPGPMITTPAVTQPSSQPGTMITTPAVTQPSSQPGTMITTPASEAAVDPECPCSKKGESQEESQAASLVDYQTKDAQVEFSAEEKEQIRENLKESDISKMWWVNPQVDGKPYFGTEASRDYSSYLSMSLDSIAKTKKQWDKIDKKELDRDSKKEKVEHEKDAVKDDQSKINKLKKGKPSVKKSVEVHDLKKDQEFDKEDKIKYSKAEKGNLPPWLQDKKELKKDSKKEKVEHEKDAVKDDKKQIKDLKKDEKEDKKSEKKDKK